MITVMRRSARAVGSVVLWLLALLGAGCGALWVAHAFGLVQPLIVETGSMAPEIDRGDLLFALPTPVEEVAVGDVTTLPSTLKDTLVTHRVIAVAPSADTVEISMKGDANDVDDPETYIVAAGSSVWQPVLTVPGAGRVLMAVARPAVLIPLALAVLALASLSFVPADRPASENAGADASADREGDTLPLPAATGAR